MWLGMMAIRYESCHFTLQLHPALSWLFVVKVMGSYEINEKVSNVSKDIGLLLKEESKSVTEVMTLNIICPELFNQKWANKSPLREIYSTLQGLWV